jgi:cardiolipin synthase C
MVEIGKLMRRCPKRYARSGKCLPIADMHRQAMLRIVLLSMCLLIGAGCSSLPPLDSRSTSMMLTDTGATRLGRAVSPRVATHPGQSGIIPLRDARDAFAVRAHLAQVAERSLDVQYYIWHKDMTGSLLFEALRAAADRGVRVRLLLDDNQTAGLDGILAALDAHPNIEVRLFNPFLIRSPRWVGYVIDFARANRRMHNKSFTADNQVTIIGGRNVGDEYFGAADGMLFSDLDVMAVGPVVNEVSNEFDRYWASGSSYPVDRLLPPADREAMAELGSAVARLEHDPAAIAYMNAIRNASFVHQLTQGAVPIEWAATRMIIDDPAKGLGQAAPDALVLDKLRNIIGESAGAVDLVSPYFVLSAAGVTAFTAMARRGVAIRVLTNSLEATDVVAVHAGYAKRRRALLEAGVTLYELRSRAPDSEPRVRPGLMGSSGSSLHAKTFAVDNSHVFIGSFNFDPRSINLNTEMGFVIDSPPLARKLHEAFNESIPARAYEVRLSDTGQLYWLEPRGGEVLRYDTEPGTRLWQRALVSFLALLPIDWLL